MADLIERYKITANLPSVLMNYCNRFNSKQLESITEMIYELENSIESADVQPVKRGKWSKQGLKRDGFGGFTVGFICSACKEFVPFKGNYCPNCGARMDGDTE